jgi:prepilin-type N-terminal cleavage/methylation domain-containing protein
MAVTCSPSRIEDENGFTLIELLVGMSIVALLIGAIGSALVVALRTTDATNTRMSLSHDVQITSAYLANDVQSARTVALPGACALPAGMSHVIEFDYASATACYGAGTASNGETQVVRTFNGSTSVLAHFAGTAQPNVTCRPSPCTATPDAVTIAFNESGGSTYTLLGARRYGSTTGAGAGTGAPSGADLTLLATGSSPLVVKGGCKKSDVDNNLLGCTIFDSKTQNDQSKLAVNGNLYVNAGVNGAVKVTGHANIAATGAFKILLGGTCQGCNNGNTSPWPIGSYSPALPDPLRYMAAPSDATQRSCSGPVLQPGTYGSACTLNSSTTLQPGVYIFQNGLSVGGNANIVGNGVTLYVSGSGNLSFAGGSTVNLTPPTSGPYHNILIFQSRANTRPLSLSGGTSLNQAQFAGIIYAPAATNVTLGTGGANMHVVAVVAQNITITGNTQVTIG